MTSSHFKSINCRSHKDNIWTLIFDLYLCHLLEFNSDLTGDPRSTEIAYDYSPNSIVGSSIIDDRALIHNMSVHVLFIELKVK